MVLGKTMAGSELAPWFLRDLIYTDPVVSDGLILGTILASISGFIIRKQIWLALLNLLPIRIACRVTSMLKKGSASPAEFLRS